MPLAELSERMDSDERALLAVIQGLEELESRYRKFEAALDAGERSYYRPEDDDEIRRMLFSYLSFRTALLRAVWFYQRNEELDTEPARLRALLLHYTAAAVAYDYAARFVLAFDGKPIAIRKLNEEEPRWDLRAGTYDAIRANLAHVSHRRWLEAGWKKYHETLPRWKAEPAFAGPQIQARHAVFHQAIATAGENTAWETSPRSGRFSSIASITCDSAMRSASSLQSRSTVSKLSARNDEGSKVIPILFEAQAAKVSTP
jgi:hypothetical protein